MKAQSKPSSARGKLNRKAAASRLVSRKATVNMDNKQRVCLTRVLSDDERANFDTFRIYREGGKIILEPVVQVPEQDHWIYKDEKTLNSLLKGIRDAEEGRLIDLGSFADYADEGKD